MMLPPEEIAEQQQLLAAHRRTLAIYLRQQAELGGHAYSPPALLSGVDEARRNIARIKALLRGVGVAVDDDPDDDAAPMVDARRERPISSPATARQSRMSQRALLAVVGIVCVALAVAVARLLFAANLSRGREPTPQPTAQTFTVLGEAMEPNFASGQVVAIETVDPAALRRGDVVVVAISVHPFLKRIVGLPGETVSIHDGGVYVDDRLLDEPYTRGAATTCGPGSACDQGRSISVLPGTVFVLGDNRMNSSDSREFGPVPVSQIKGRVR